MFRPVARGALRASTPFAPTRRPAARRFASTAPPTAKSRSWKSLGARWALAVGAVYYYNTSDVFAEGLAHTADAPDAANDDRLPTIEELAAERKRRQATVAAPSVTAASDAVAIAPPAGTEDGVSSPEELQEEADQQGAFNPETGEINWDCPCLGGMAHGPCGEEFRAAFSCFVYSTEEPKGMDCIDKFKGMQDCFRAHPDVYGAELEGEDEEDESVVTMEHVPGDESAPAAAAAAAPAEPSPAPAPPSDEASPTGARQQAKVAADEVRQHEPVSESDEVVPKAWHDQREQNQPAGS